MAQGKIIVTDPVGLHARPAATFVKTAQKFKSSIQVKNLTSGKGPADAKSILGVLTLAVNQGHEIEITAEGEDADSALSTLITLVKSDFVAS